MSYDEEQQKRSRMVIETPTARREVISTSTARVPERRGLSGGVVAALVIGSVALVTLLFLFILNRQSTDSAVTANQRTETVPTPVQPLVVQQPAQQQPLPPIIIQQPGATTSQPPIIIEQTVQPAAPSDASAPTSPTGAHDATIQSEIDRKMAEDAALSTVAVTARVSQGRVTLNGTADTAAIKNQVERLVRSIRGVKGIDNQIVVSGG